ncbi:hypothetical protein AB0J80_28545 [Actinoplanes sp. NPDC049548]|uniref:hypothetical protein n=1 Tax=Actinoplanes sp. NPDC049548 TaxID=3155152 RepID=UPI0034365F04
MPRPEAAEALAQQHADMLRLARTLHDLASNADRSDVVGLADEIILALDGAPEAAGSPDTDREDRGPAALRLIDRVLQGIPL